ncbi:MAG: VOC family protein [Alphaproteobacteria bacterium]|nr:VOC family protein [Alphaproteobacteria bacterium]
MTETEGHPWMQSPDGPAQRRARTGTIRRASPVFPVESVAVAVSYYFDGLGFEPVAPGEDYAIVARDGVEIHLCRKGAGGLPPGGAFVEVDDVDALYRELARNARVECAGPPETMPWGEREFHLRDPDGNVLRFSQRTGD